MQVIIKGGFTYTAEFIIKEEAYAKLLSDAKTFGEDNVDAMLGLYLEKYVKNIQTNAYDTPHKFIKKILYESTIQFKTFFPSNHVTMTLNGCDGLLFIHPHYTEQRKRIQLIADQFAIEFRFRDCILKFISGELKCGDIVDKE